jgi:hypothetical protein
MLLNIKTTKLRQALQGILLALSVGLLQSTLRQHDTL